MTFRTFLHLEMAIFEAQNHFFDFSSKNDSKTEKMLWKKFIFRSIDLKILPIMLKYNADPENKKFATCLRHPAPHRRAHLIVLLQIDILIQNFSILNADRMIRNILIHLHKHRTWGLHFFLESLKYIKFTELTRSAGEQKNCLESLFPSQKPSKVSIMKHVSDRKFFKRSKYRI